MSTELQQKELAPRIGFSPNYISLVESGRREPSLSFLRRYCNEIGISLSVLFMNEGHRKESDFEQVKNSVDVLAEYLVREKSRFKDQE